MEQSEQTPGAEAELLPLSLQVPPDLWRAYQRCTWMIINETGRDQHSVMAEMVRDFLIKHGC
jgi:hypothetical protein